MPMTLLTKEVLEQMLEDDPTLLTDLLRAPPRPTMMDMILPAADDRWPHLVHYRHSKVTYVPPDRFLFRIDPDGPSDCTWIVPGTNR